MREEFVQTCETFNTVNISGLRTGFIYWQKGDITLGFSQLLEYLGCEVISFPFDARLPEDLDVVLAIGPYGSLVPLTNQLLACPISQRPAFIFLMSEQFPNPRLPEWLRYGVGMMRSRAERLAFHQRAPGDWRLRPWLSWLTAKATRFRYYGDLYWLHRQGILSVLGISSQWTANFLRARGFDPFVQHLGYHPDQWTDLKLDRDIPVLWLGKTGTARRGRLLKGVRAELKERGIEMLVIDGEENPYVFGKKRTILLKRTKIVLNLLRTEWDDNSMRYGLAMPRGALVVTEPTLPHTCFIPGVHLVETPIEQMADTICYYLSHEEERQRIVDRAYQLITKHSVVEEMIQILEKAAIARQNAMFEER